MSFNFRDPRQAIRLEEIYSEQRGFRRDRGFRQAFEAAVGLFIAICVLYFVLHY